MNSLNGSLKKRPLGSTDKNVSNVLTPWLLRIGLLFAFCVVLLISSIPLTLEQQTLFVLASLGLSLLIRPDSDDSRFRLVVLIIISCLTTGRYIFWRLTESLGWFGTNLDLTFWDYFFSAGLLMAEFYAWLVLFLGYFQTLWPLKREPVALSNDRSTWPMVDVFIPTYNEPLKVVSPSVVAARDLDWPADKLNVYILDDGCREEFRQFAEEANVHYIDRKESTGAKAGNINRALEKTHGEYIAIFDCDHVPVRSFLTTCMGWFARDKKLGLLQTPHLFFTPDPLERNLQVYHRVPNEGQLFYGLVQDGNDTWNATFFCGSCAVLAREALEEVGGIATETVTEDAHTSLRMHMKGWNSAYLNQPLAAGLATERLSGHIGQRIRWSRGMIQILRKDNPLFAKGLKLGQRLGYFNAMMHFMYALPRLIFLTSPLAYLFFEVYVIQATAAMIAVYALPHIFQANVANSAMQGRFRHSFWADIYETILAPHILKPTSVALVAPDKGTFNVTEKGGVVDKDQFDWGSSKVIFFLLLMNIAGLVLGIIRFFWWNVSEQGTVIINLSWTVYNSIILGAALAVAWEKRQRRQNARIHRRFDAVIYTSDDEEYDAKTVDISTGDMSLELDESASFNTGELITIELLNDKDSFEFTGRVVTLRNKHLGVLLEDLDAESLAHLVRFSHSMDHAWDQWYIACEPSKPLSSLWEIIRFGIGGALRALFGHSDDPENPDSRLKTGYSVSGLLFIIFLVTMTSLFSPGSTHASEITRQNPEGFIESKDITLTLDDIGIKNDILLRGGSTLHGAQFYLRADQIVTQASFELHFTIKEKVLNDYSSIDVRLNNQRIGEIILTEHPLDETLKLEFPIDPLFVSDINYFSFKLVPNEENFCEKLDPKKKEAIISNTSVVKMHVEPLELVNDLKYFPTPFFDRNDDEPLLLPFVFDQQMVQSTDAIKAAGILSSWFGIKADYRGMDFPVQINQITPHHTVVFATPRSNFRFLPSLNIQGPGVVLTSHPQYPHRKLLVITGNSGADFIDAVNTLISEKTSLSGSRLNFNNPVVPKIREAYDAPRWLENDKKIYFSELVSKEKLYVKGLIPDSIDIDLRIPPDLFSWQHENIPVKFTYGYTDLPLHNDSTFSMDLNYRGLRSFRLGHDTFLIDPHDPQPPPTYIPDFEKKNAKAFLPLDELIGTNRINYFFDYVIPPDFGTKCIDLYVDHMAGWIEEDSYIDLRGFYHFAQLPDLAKFANLGYPFTRFADLSETAAILPLIPNQYDVYTFLNTMGKMGASTGHPVHNVAVLTAKNIEEAKKKDLLLIGDARRQPLFDRWREWMPIESSSAKMEITNDKPLSNEQLKDETNGTWQLRKLTGYEELQRWWKGERDESDLKAIITLTEQGQNLIGITSFRSPLARKRSVVAMVASNPEKLPRTSQALLHPDDISRIHGDLIVIVEGETMADDEILEFQLLPTYYTGKLPVLTSIRWYLSTHVLSLVLLMIISTLLSTVLILFVMRRYIAQKNSINPQ